MTQFEILPLTFGVGSGERRAGKEIERVTIGTSRISAIDAMEGDICNILNFRKMQGQGAYAHPAMSTVYIL
jgi:hypothetical protein